MAIMPNSMICSTAPAEYLKTTILLSSASCYQCFIVFIAPDKMCLSMCCHVLSAVTISSAGW